MSVPETPVYHLWVFDPQSATVSVEDNEGRHHAETLTHQDMAEGKHIDSAFGYAYKINHGWRITDNQHKQVTDPYIVHEVLKALR